MTLEQLKAMSDAELNELSAVKVKGWNVSKEDDGTDETFLKRFDGDTWHILSAEWNPTTDMNDSIELWNRLHSEGWELSLSCDHKITTPWDCRMFYKENKRVIAHEKTAPRVITIASILAKEETE